VCGCVCVCVCVYVCACACACACVCACACACACMCVLGRVDLCVCAYVRVCLRGHVCIPQYVYLYPCALSLSRARACSLFPLSLNSSCDSVVGNFRNSAHLRFSRKTCIGFFGDDCECVQKTFNFILIWWARSGAPYQCWLESGGLVNVLTCECPDLLMS